MALHYPSHRDYFGFSPQSYAKLINNITPAALFTRAGKFLAKHLTNYESMSEQGNLYKTYVNFKGWTGTTQSSPDQYEELLRLSKLKAPAEILEIGFGDGAFLDWAAVNGFRTTGIEIIPEVVRQVGSRHKVILVDRL
jgi:spermidine synthase